MAVYNTTKFPLAATVGLRKTGSRLDDRLGKGAVWQASSPQPRRQASRIPSSPAWRRCLTVVKVTDMGKQHAAIDAKLEQWIGRQQLFFVATAPERGGHVNVSPKGPIASLRVLDPRTVAYLDQVGSGIETVAHLRQNGRICLMLCAFQGPPRIVRLHGRGEVLAPPGDEFTDLAARFDISAIPAADRATRSVVKVNVDRIADSCGYGVPLMDYRGQRPQSQAWVESKIAKGGERAMADYMASHNAESIDGLTGI
jgi:hypothetical protein